MSRSGAATTAVLPVRPQKARGLARRIPPEARRYASELSVRDFAEDHALSPHQVRLYVSQGMPAYFHAGKFTIRNAEAREWLHRKFSAPTRVAQIVDSVVGDLRR